jgi:GT2 family glycosyltransferase
MTETTDAPIDGARCGPPQVRAGAAVRQVTVVIPTVGRPSLAETLAAVGPGPAVVVVDDRPGPAASLPPLPVPDHVRVLRSGGRGPAAARNVGWKAATTPWVAFLDDDVVPASGWADALGDDLAGLPGDVGGSQGRVDVPVPVDRRPTDAERHTAGLAHAHWITADMTYRRAALEAAGGFDERFPGAYREDGDIALRVERAGYTLVKGRRVTRHPAVDHGFWSSVRFQRGNADDALMRHLHGPRWRAAVGGRPGRLKRHALTTAAGLLAAALTGIVALRPDRAGEDRRRLLPLEAAAGAAWCTWLGLTAEFAWVRIAPGPRTPEEIVRMVVTSVLIPPVACAQRLRGEIRVLAGRLGGRRGTAPSYDASRERPC